MSQMRQPEIKVMKLLVESGLIPSPLGAHASFMMESASADRQASTCRLLYCFPPCWDGGQDLGLLPAACGLWNSWWGMGGSGPMCVEEAECLQGVWPMAAWGCLLQGPEYAAMPWSGLLFVESRDTCPPGGPGEKGRARPEVGQRLTFHS